MCGWRPNSYEIYKSRRWGDCTFARASPVSLSRKPLSPDIEATPKTNLPISFALARSSPNMASYWFYKIVGVEGDTAILRPDWQDVSKHYHIGLVKTVCSPDQGRHHEVLIRGWGGWMHKHPTHLPTKLSLFSDSGHSVLKMLEKAKF